MNGGPTGLKKLGPVLSHSISFQIFLDQLFGDLKRLVFLQPFKHGSLPWFLILLNTAIEETEMAKEDYKLRVDSVRLNFQGATCQARRTEMAQDRMAREKAPK